MAARAVMPPHRMTGRPRAQTTAQRDGAEVTAVDAADAAWQGGPYTDLAIEATAALRGRSGTEIPGVRMQEHDEDGVRVSRVEVLSPEGEQAIGKQQGRYITLDAPDLRQHIVDVQEHVGRILTRELAALLGLRDQTSQSVLVVGLGNASATPDALGPRVVRKLLITRHLKDYVPPEVRGALRPVAAVAPGVLGSTGIETGEIIQGIVEHIHPDVVVAIDALAARSVDRIGTSIQLADTGIHPGSGLGARRVGLNQQTLGVPVLAVGVPTVVHAATIVYDTIEMLGVHLQGKNPFFEAVTRYDARQRRQLIEEVLAPKVGPLVVTPKEVDELIDDMARIVAGSLNEALHTSPEAQEFLRYL